MQNRTITPSKSKSLGLNRGFQHDSGLLHICVPFCVLGGGSPPAGGDMGSGSGSVGIPWPET